MLKILRLFGRKVPKSPPRKEIVEKFDTESAEGERAGATRMVPSKISGFLR